MRAIVKKDPLGGCPVAVGLPRQAGERGQQAEIGARPRNRWSSRLLCSSQHPKRLLYLVLQSWFAGMWPAAPGRSPPPSQLYERGVIDSPWRPLAFAAARDACQRSEGLRAPVTAREPQAHKA